MKARVHRQMTINKSYFKMTAGAGLVGKKPGQGKSRGKGGENDQMHHTHI